MSIVDTVLGNINKIFEKGIKRKPQEFLYIDKAALREHYKAITGLYRVPVGFTQSSGATSGAGLFGLSFDVSGSQSTNFELSETHLFESLEPVLREKYKIIDNEDDVIASFREFGWYRGNFYWQRVGPTMLGDEVTEEARTYYLLYAAGLPFILLCNEEAFSPFARYISKDPDAHQFNVDIEVLAYNPGALGHYGKSVQPYRTLLLAPTVILIHETRSKEEIATWLRDMNKGFLSQFYPYNRKPEFLNEKETNEEI